MTRIEKLLLAVLGAGLAWAFAVVLMAAGETRAAVDSPPSAGIETVEARYWVHEATDLAYLPRVVFERMVESNKAFADEIRRLNEKGCR